MMQMANVKTLDEKKPKRNVAQGRVSGMMKVLYGKFCNLTL